MLSIYPNELDNNKYPSTKTVKFEPCLETF